MWPNSCVITTKCAAYYTCLSPTTCRPVFSLPALTEAIWWDIVSWGRGRWERRNRAVMDAEDRGRNTRRAAWVAIKLNCTRTYNSHLSEITTPRLKRILQLPGRLGKSPLQRVLVSLPVKCMHCVAVCEVQSCMCASTLGNVNARPLYDFRP